MTTLGLTFLIVLAIVAQIALFAGIAFFRHWANYQELRARVETGGAHLPTPPPSSAAAPGAAALPKGEGQPRRPPAWEGFRPFRVARRVVEDAVGTICSFHLEPVDGAPLPGYLPGQFLTFKLEATDPQTGLPKSLVRCYSLSDRPHPDHYRVSIKRVPAPPNRPELPPGSPPATSMIRSRRAISSRCAPRRAISICWTTRPIRCCRWCWWRGDRHHADVVHAQHPAGCQRSAPAVALLRGAPRRRGDPARPSAGAGGQPSQLPSPPLLQRPAPGGSEGIGFPAPGTRGHPAAAPDPAPAPPSLLHLRPQADDGKSGPGPRRLGGGGGGHPLRGVRAGLGAPSRTCAAAPRPRRGQPARDPITVTFQKSGRSIPWDGSASILEFAEAHGIAVDSGCRAGGCGCCKTALQAGEVAYSREPDAEIEPGHCLLCISTPKSDLTLEA
jgi:uncharacterized protein